MIIKEGYLNCKFESGTQEIRKQKKISISLIVFSRVHEFLIEDDFIETPLKKT
jgi:hypothetical protein